MLLQELPLQNTLDVMNVERNISKNILKYLFGDNDIIEVCKNLEKAGVMQHLWLHQQGGESYKKPQAPYVFTQNEAKAFVDFVGEVQTPTGYASAFKKHVGNQRLQHIKSHDHHVMVQQVMPTCIRNLLQLGPCKTLICLGIVFQCICTKVLNQNETLCMLEFWFPLAFFDLVTHLVIYLVDKLEICRSISTC